MSEIKETFDFVEDYPGYPNQTLIRLRNAPFEGAIFKYGTVKLKEENDRLACTYDYNLIETTGPLDPTLKPEFEKIVNDILTYCLQNHNKI